MGDGGAKRFLLAPITTERRGTGPALNAFKAG